MSTPESAELINGLISMLDSAADTTRDVCAERHIAFDDAVVMVGINGASIGPVVKALHELKATSSKIDILESQFKRECVDTDKLLESLGLDPRAARTDGGSLRINHIKTLLETNKG